MPQKRGGCRGHVQETLCTVPTVTTVVYGINWVYTWRTKMQFHLVLSELPNMKGKVCKHAYVCICVCLCVFCIFKIVEVCWHSKHFTYSDSVNSSTSQLWSYSPSPNILLTHKTITDKDKPINQCPAVGFPPVLVFYPELGNFWKQHFIWWFLVHFLVR